MAKHNPLVVTTPQPAPAFDEAPSKDELEQLRREAGRYRFLTDTIADVIWTMTAAHRAAILAQFPDLADRVWMLSPGRRDVIDPIGGSQETYRRCVAQIREHLESRIDTLGLAAG